ncbi:MAG: hypothetical protein R3F13_04075 [Prosthecobacter sp.]
MSWLQIPTELPPASTVLLYLTATLFLLMVRIVFLLRTHGRLQDQSRSLQDTIVAQHQDLITVRQDGNAWRGQVQVMMDAFRADLTRRTDAADDHSRALGALLKVESKNDAEKSEPTKAPAPPPFIPLPSLS